LTEVLLLLSAGALGWATLTDNLLVWRALGRDPETGVIIPEYTPPDDTSYRGDFGQRRLLSSGVRGVESSWT
jgi:hypothetical protein